MKKESILSQELSGYSAKSVCRSLEINKSTYYRWLSESQTEKKHSYKKEFYDNVLSLIKDILSDKRYCMYGHRRVRALLKRKHKIKIGVKKVGKLMRENGLCQPYYTRRNGFKRIEKPEVTGPNQYWQIDMTIGYLEDSMPIYTIGIKDVFTREIVALKGYFRARSLEWYDCLNKAVMEVFSEGRAVNGLVLGSDNGCQPTSRFFRDKCSTLNIEIRYTGYKHPKENGSIERFFRTLKEEHLWLNNYKTIDDYNAGLNAFKEFYNRERMHSSLDYKSPYEFKHEYFTNIKLDKEEVLEYNNICTN